MPPILLKSVVSGGQTGVDRAALDAAMTTGVPVGGWCPKGRLAEDGPIAARYPLKETPTADYPQRTEWNVRDSDATLILSSLPLEGGTAQTEKAAKRLGKPCLAVDPRQRGALDEAKKWLAVTKPGTLNVAGPRASRWFDGYALSFTFLCVLFSKRTGQQLRA